LSEQLNSSWVPTAYRIQLSKNREYLLIIAEGKLLSVKVDLLFEVLAGHRESLRLFVLEDHR
jgi:hypothetical protein